MSKKRERWVFTDNELRHPENCKRSDSFFANLPDDLNGVVTDRRGLSQDRYTDGIVGVSSGHANYAEAQDSLSKTGSGSVAFGAGIGDTWKDVWTNEGGDFLGFAH